MPYVLVEATAQYEKNHGPWGGPERIDVDISNPQQFKTVDQYWEKKYWGENYGWITFKVRVQIERIGHETTKIHIKYSRKDNQHLFDNLNIGEDYISWGTHTLIVNVGESFGRSIWNGDEGPGWKKEQIKGDQRRITTTRLQRDQARFREMLLSSDRCCAVTCESCPAVLEAAHIVPVRNGGQEVLSNGILLRADLHRLFDTDPPQFEICSQTGTILVDEDFRYGSFDLHGAQIEAVLLERIADALDVRHRTSR